MQDFDSKQFFETLTQTIDKSQNVAAVVASVLSISIQSAYRKLKGESELTVSEYFKLKYFLDQKLHTPFLDSNADFIFHYADSEQSAVQLREIIAHMQSAIVVDNDVNMHYVANDISLLQVLQVPELASFKLFYMLNSVYGKISPKKVVFNWQVADSFRLHRVMISRLLASYLRVPETMVMGPHAFQHLLYQIQYYYAAGFFESPQIAHTLIQKIEDLLQHIIVQAQERRKFQFGTSPTALSVPFELYYNRLMNVNNMVLLQSAKDQNTIVLTHGLNYLQTRSALFYSKQMNWVANLKHKSQMISGGSERDQLLISNQLQQQIDHAKLALAKGSAWL